MIRLDLVVYIQQEKTYEDTGNSDDARNDSPQWREDATTTKLMSMGITNVHDARYKNVIDVGDQNFDVIKK